LQKQIIPKYGGEKTDARKRIPMNDACNAFHSNDARKGAARSSLAHPPGVGARSTTSVQRAGTLDCKQTMMASSLTKPTHHYVSLKLGWIMEAKLQRNSRKLQHHLDPKTCTLDSTRAKREMVRACWNDVSASLPV